MFVCLCAGAFKDYHPAQIAQLRWFCLQQCPANQRKHPHQLRKINIRLCNYMNECIVNRSVVIITLFFAYETSSSESSKPSVTFQTPPPSDVSQLNTRLEFFLQLGVFLGASKNTVLLDSSSFLPPLPCLFLSLLFSFFCPPPSLSFSVFMLVFVLRCVMTGSYGQRQ